MKKNKISKGVKHRLSILFPLTICVFIGCLWTMGTYAYNIYSLKQEELELKKELEDLIKEEELLSDEIIKLKDPDYIAKYARENYFYTKKGEYVIKINEIEKEKEEIIEEHNSKAYYILGFGVVLLVILIFILKNKKEKRIS